jgi:hypothetical protein
LATADRQQLEWPAGRLVFGVFFEIFFCRIYFRMQLVLVTACQKSRFSLAVVLVASEIGRM